MTDNFRDDIHRLVARIPEGKVASYGQLALLAGKPRAARIVGQIMSRAGGEGLPCHRVVKSDGSLCAEDTFGVYGLQRELLRSEGVSFRADGRVNMADCRWDGLSG